MPCPQSTEYNEAIQNLRSCVSDDELREGQPALSGAGLPILWSGNFADVYKVHCPTTGNTWAVKCFTREVRGLRERYREISAHLEEARLPFMVDFRYVEPGIQVGRDWHPFLKMRWVEGLALNEFVGQYLDRPATLRQLVGLWVKLAARLRDAQIAHADLQHGNVLLVPLPQGQLALRLIDYDGMYVPALAGRRSGELGHPAYQHPQRLRQGIYSLEVDRFSHLAIFCSIRCLIAGRRELWRFHTGENLLFRERDFARPERSQVFRELWALPDAEARSLVGRLFLAAQRPLAETPLLGDILSNGSVLPLSGEEEGTVESALRGGGVVAQPWGVPAPEGAASDDKRAWWAGAPSPRPVPEASAGGAMGTMPDVTSGTQATPLKLRPPRPAQAPRPHSNLRGALRWADGVLRTLAGEENVILHNFLRVLAVVVLALLILVGVRMGPQWIANAVALIAQGKAVEQAAVPTTPLPAALPAPPPEPAEGEEKVEGMKEEVPVVAALAKEITVDLGDGVTMDLVLIPAGEFLMGSPDSDDDADDDEKPQHQVRITQPFYLGKYQVTQEQWEAVMGRNPSRFKDPQNPVETVSWDDCQAFLRRLNEEQGGRGATFRLPTEAEWEYACRAGSSTRWCFGDNEAGLGDYAWCGSNSGGRTHAVGENRPNLWGLYDVHGNVWEWCADWYEGQYYATSPANDPKGPTAGTSRVLRGGAWVSSAGLTRLARRLSYAPGTRDRYFGFRVARSCGGGPSTGVGPEPTEPLRITPIPPQSVEAGRPLTVAVSVENAAVWEGKVRYSLAPEPPNGAEIDQVTGVFSWTPAQEEGPGAHEVTVLATGPDGQADEHTFAVTVTAPREAVTSANEITVDLDGVTMEMVLIPAGEFLMGSPDSDRDLRDEEKPQHQVRITQPFYLGKYEVTQEQWEAVMGHNPSQFKGSKNPVEEVSWDDCQGFLVTLNQKYRRTGATFRLPTEAEWEYACRAGSSTRWSFGDEEASLGEYAWYSGNSANSTHPVGQKRPNAWGLYDVYGNVYEWCNDWSLEDYYRNSPPTDPKGPNSGRARAVRGGSWGVNAWYARSAFRGRYSPGNRGRNYGLRVARTCGDGPSKASVSNATGPLRIKPIPPQTVEAGRPLFFAVTGGHGGLGEGGLRYRLAPGAPSGATIDAATGIFTWTPTQPQGPGRYEVTVLAAGPDGQADEHTFVVTVTAPKEVAAIPLEEIRVDLGRGVTMDLVRIPPGEFLMGSPDSDPNAQSDEKPRHQVRITQPFYLGKYEVTQEQWDAVMEGNPSSFKGPKNPVDHVAWNDCQTFLSGLNEKYGSPTARFLLPTEAQWEYASRAGSSARWCFGDDETSLGEYAWYDANSGRRTHPVGKKKPNDWGLYDMHGNVAEWCADWHDRGYHGSFPLTDPEGPGSGSVRVLRGGSWGNSVRYSRSANRIGYGPVNRDPGTGFRVARTP